MDSDRRLQVGRIGCVALGGGGDDAHAQRLGQQELVAWPRATLLAHPAGMDGAHHRQAELGLVVVDGVSAGDHAAGLGHLFGRAAQDLADGRRGQLGRKGGDAQGQDHLPAHGIDVAHGIGRGDRAIGIGIVHHRREKVGGKDEGLARR